MTLAPTVARVDSLSQWAALFHPQTGVFRLPSTKGSTIQHLDIDIRFVDADEEALVRTARTPVTPRPTLQPIHLPNVCILTLRGAEHVHDSDERMEILAEVLRALKPVEVHWLNASNDPDEQLTFATHLVHPAIIAAGETWAMDKTLRRLVVQGGFPCPNLTSPTPFSITPATTPCPSPGPLKHTFGASMMSAISSAKPAKSPVTPGSPALFPALVSPKPMSSASALSASKPLSTLASASPAKVKNDEERLKARAERRRLADYSLKPRFEFAFGSWGAEEIVWGLDGRYTNACKTSIIEQLLKAMSKSFPFPSAYSDLSMPAAISFTPLSPKVVASVRDLPDEMGVNAEFKSYLADTCFFSMTHGGRHHARLFERQDKRDWEEDRSRQARRFKADMTLLNGTENEIVDFDKLMPGDWLDMSALQRVLTDSEGQEAARSPDSAPSLDPLNSTDDESDEAITPEPGSMVMASTPMQTEKGVTDGDIRLEHSPMGTVVE